MTGASEGNVVVAAEHPVLGLVYWTYDDGTECNSAEHYGLSDQVRSALQLPSYWRQHDHFNWAHGRHLQHVFDEMNPDSDFQEEEDQDAGRLDWVLYGTLALLQEESGQTVEEFVRWALAAAWVDIPAAAAQTDGE
ncbi:hypothetical protein [Pseudomonas sp. EMN2]|uniref:hypothetical protein n=1 Tax=Pseudomonas sp. EMN2 TaxID=2615212 RepID=UPI00129AAF0B|nr:hypothetical protein [Pseudomonas sp. EMN2]